MSVVPIAHRCKSKERKCSNRIIGLGKKYFDMAAVSVIYQANFSGQEEISGWHFRRTIDEGQQFCAANE